MLTFSDQHSVYYKHLLFNISRPFIDSICCSSTINQWNWIHYTMPQSRILTHRHRFMSIRYICRCDRLIIFWPVLLLCEADRLRLFWSIMLSPSAQGVVGSGLYRRICILTHRHRVLSVKVCMHMRQVDHFLTSASPMRSWSFAPILVNHAIA